MTAPKPQPLLWPFIALELLSLVIWTPIAALAGMGYTPKFSWSNVLLAGFHLYPAYMLLAFPIAFALRSSDRHGPAVIVVLLPPFLSLGSFSLLVALAKGLGW